MRVVNKNNARAGELFFISLDDESNAIPTKPTTDPANNKTDVIDAQIMYPSIFF